MSKKASLHAINQENPSLRVYRHMLAHDSGILTASRYTENCGSGQRYTIKESRARNRSLLAKLLNKNYGLTSVKGIYIENYGSSDAIKVKEETFLVVDLKDKGNLKKDLIRLGREFEQDSIMFVPKGAENGLLIGTNKCPKAFPGYNKIKKYDHPIFGKSGEYMTKVNGRPFILESIKEDLYSTHGFFGMWGVSIAAKEDWREFIE